MLKKRYWPRDFLIVSQLSDEDKRDFGFLESAAREGFQSFECEGLLGASAENGRDGDIVRRGGRGRYWEIDLSENQKVVTSLFVDGFETATNAVLRWLRGDEISHIYDEIKHAVLKKPGGEHIDE